MEKGYFLVADVLGFSTMLENLSDKERCGELLDSRIHDWIRIVETAKEMVGLTRIQMISDTVFAATDDSKEGLDSIIAFSKRLLELGIDSYYPVRGGISHGDYTWGNLTYGQAVVDAHKHEQNQEWIGISLDAMPKHEPPWGFGGVILYFVPTKLNFHMARPTVSWQVPCWDELLHRCTGKHTYKKNMIVPPAVIRKVDNTAIFGTYRYLMEQVGRAPNLVWGESMIPIIERILFPPGNPGDPWTWDRTIK